ncbi:MAG: FGGY-family carbohydrate kinase [Candidatus Bipolaricaulia bacterium]
MPFLVGVDIGTQGTKAVLVDLDGKILSTGFEEYGVLHPRPLWAEQWPDIWFDATCKTIHEAVTKANINTDEVAGISLSGLYGGSGIPVDKKMNPVRPCLIWMDRRAVDEVEWIMNDANLDRLFEITGNYVDTYYGFPKILWIKNKEPGNWKKIDKFVPPSCYVAYRLTGELTVDYSSAGNLAGVFDLHRRAWSEEMANLLGIPIEMMPERIVDSNEVIGELTQQAADRIGLKAGTPVVGGGIDAPMATLGVGAFEAGDHVAMMGTSTCWGTIHDGQNLDQSLVSMPHVASPEEIIYSWAGSATSGAVVRWFRDEFGAVEVESGQRLDLDPFTLMDLKASKIGPGSDGLLVLPYFMGERAPVWDARARGLLIGLTLYHTKEHVFKAFMEGVGYALRHSIEAGEGAGILLKDECIVTGGVAKSPLWMQILADVTHRPIVTISATEGAPLADALLAGMGVGLIDDYQLIKEWIEYNDPVEPIKANSKIYDQYYRQYREIYTDVKERMHILSDLAEGA